MNALKFLGLTVLAYALVLPLVYLFALAGHPQSVWLMCDVLSLC